MDKHYNKNILTEEEKEEFKKEMNQEKVSPLGNAAMMAKVNKSAITIKPLREWQEKEGNRLLDSVRIYIGNMQLGTCFLKNKNEDLYIFHPFSGMHSLGYIKDKTLIEIKDEIELQLKEFVKKITL